MTPLLKVSNVSKNFGGVKALTEVSFEIYKGQRVSLVGENGSGKSTIIKIISGVLEAASGSIIIDGVVKEKLTPKEAIDHGIQVIYQDFSLYPNLTVEENLAYNYFQSKHSFFVSYKKMRHIAKHALAKIKLELPLTKLASELSIAERQMVAIAKVLLEDARIIIMDEATTALTQKEIKNLIKVTEDLQKEGIALIFVSHKLEEIQAVSDRCVFLRNGMKITEAETKTLSQKDIVKHMSGIDYNEKKPFEIDTKNRKKIIEYKNIYTYSLKDISFEIHEGEIVGLAGLLGSGRSDIALSMFGAEKITKGDFIFDGKKVRVKTIQDAMKLGIGYVPEDRLREALFLDKSIGLNMLSAKYSETSSHTGLIDNKKLNELAEHWSKELTIKLDKTTNSVSSLSGGNQQRVVLARWLMRDLKLMILNHPTVGVDISAKQEINEIIIRLAKEGMSFLVISDDLPEFVHLCHKVYFVKNGAINDSIFYKDITTENLKEHLNKE